ncbi:hypothetical protein CU098_007031, partial [Rhizopus stolonifer]
NIVQDIVQYGDKFKEFIQGQKSNGFEIVGYARKSPGEKDKEKRARLLRTMIDKLRSRSLVDKVFVSQSSLANEPFNKRDINDDVFEGANGSTRDLLKFLNFFRNASNSGYFGLRWSLDKCRRSKEIFK